MPSQKDLLQTALADALDYESYMTLMSSLVFDGKSTGIEQSEALSNYTMLNQKRMQRLNKTLKISEEISDRIAADPRVLVFLVLTESWCGDAAQSVPMWAKAAALNSNWSVLLVSRDTHPALMDAYLTAGARSIPKVLVIEPATHRVLFDWGPRPSTLTQMVLDFKAAHGLLTADFKKDLQQWYNKDKGQTTLTDMCSLLEIKH